MSPHTPQGPAATTSPYSTPTRAHSPHIRAQAPASLLIKVTLVSFGFSLCDEKPRAENQDPSWGQP